MTSEQSNTHTLTLVNFTTSAHRYFLNALIQPVSDTLDAPAPAPAPAPAQRCGICASVFGDLARPPVALQVALTDIGRSGAGKRKSLEALQVWARRSV
jgi:hypothetical protein